MLSLFFINNYSALPQYSYSFGLLALEPADQRQRQYYPSWQGVEAKSSIIIPICVLSLACMGLKRTKCKIPYNPYICFSLTWNRKKEIEINKRRIIFDQELFFKNFFKYSGYVSYPRGGSYSTLSLEEDCLQIAERRNTFPASCRRVAGYFEIWGTLNPHIK